MLVFEEGKHEYKFNNIVVPSVTQVLQPLYDFEGIPDYILENARKRGQAVHYACELVDQNKLDWGSLHDEIVPYVEAWMNFKVENNFVVGMVEQRVYNEKHKFAGTLDRKGTLNGEPALLDIKATAKISKVTALQTAAYDSCFAEPSRRYCVQLKNNGSYSLVEYNNRMDFLKFITVLNFHKIRGEFS